MVLIGLLLAALACLILGVVLGNGPWLVASLVISLVAAFVLWRQREQIANGPDRPAEGPADPPPARAGRPAAATAKAIPGPAEEPGRPGPDVWVVDGRPDYHVRGCARLAGADSEQIPRPQALGDGFTACRECRPDAAMVARSPATQVWVVNGRPRYHLAGCPIIEEQPAEALALRQATEDGFIPCSLCEPNVTRV